MPSFLSPRYGIGYSAADPAISSIVAEERELDIESGARGMGVFLKSGAINGCQTDHFDNDGGPPRSQGRRPRLAIMTVL